MRTCAKGQRTPLPGSDTNAVISHSNIRCVRPKDAKTGNIVLLDVRNAGNKEDVLLGEWDGQYHLGTVSTREVDASSIVNDVSTKSTKSKSKESKSKESKSTNKSKEYLLHLVMWEPYIKDADGLLRPLWVENALREKNMAMNYYQVNGKMLCVILGARSCNFLYNTLENFSTIRISSPLKESLPLIT